MRTPRGLACLSSSGFRGLVPCWWAVAGLLMGFAALPAAPEAHRDHVSEAVLHAGEAELRGRIRFFADDLEAALRAFHGEPALHLAAGGEGDDRFAAYLAERFRLAQGGAPLAARVVGSGETQFGHHRLWWYEVVFDGYRPGRALHLHNTLLLDRFEDQQNRVVLRGPGADEQAYVLTRTADRLTLSP